MLKYREIIRIMLYINHLKKLFFSTIYNYIRDFKAKTFVYIYLFYLLLCRNIIKNMSLPFYFLILYIEHYYLLACISLLRIPVTI